MKKKTLVSIMFLVAISLSLLSQRYSWLRGDLFVVHKVLDGDTIEVEMAGRIETVRFIGIDTPETHHPDFGEQCYGQEATENLEALLTDRVQLVADPSSTNRDRYDRLLRYVYSENGDFLNIEQIKQGYAFATTAFRHSFQPVFIAAEARASNSDVGLWSTCDINIEKGYFQTQVLPT